MVTTVTTVQQEVARAEEPLPWVMDPVAFALEQGAARRSAEKDRTRPRLCTEVGRRMLRMQYGFHEWVLRRVEKVRFDHDRRVSRDISIDLRVPEYAPELAFDGQEYWLVPLTVMRRRTLVNLDLRDDEDRPITMLGLRFTQKLDEAMLRAAARLATGRRKLPQELEHLICDAVSGDWHAVARAESKVRAAQALIADQEPADREHAPSDQELAKLRRFLEAPLFREALDRMWHNFTLYVLLPRDERRHRLLRMSFDEPVDWVLQRPNLAPTTPGNDHSYDYRPYAERTKWRTNVRSMFGLAPTRIRFLTPSAENCASYHFEFTAPAGVRIARATLLAGRPNVARDHQPPRITLDDVDGYGPTVGLHGVEIPNGSLARVQVELLVHARGWLSTLLVACGAACAALASVLFHTFFEGGGTAWTPAQAGSVAAVLFGVTAGAATYVAHHESTEVGRRMVTGVRLLGAVAIAAPAVGATWLIYLGDRIDDGPYMDGKWWAEAVCLGVALVCTGLVLAAWLLARRDDEERRRISPWDMTNVAAPKGVKPPELKDRSYLGLVEEYGFDQSVLGVYSAEGWHEVYRWDESAQEAAMGLLAAPGNKTECRCSKAAHPGPGTVLVPDVVSTGGTSGTSPVPSPGT